MIVDTHCHLDDARYEEDLQEVLARAKASEVEKIVIPGADPKDLSRAKALAETYDNLYFAIGVHPYEIEMYDRNYLLAFASHPKCVAVGECGLDYFRLPDDAEEAARIKAKQKEIFVDQIDLAKALDKPLIVHIRDASADALEILTAHAGKRGGVLHCFNADEQLLKLAEKNFYFGIGGVLTFKNARKLVNVLPKIPLERMVLETDAPYLTPHPHRGTRNEPAYTALVAQKVSELLGIDYDEVIRITSANAHRLFGDAI